ncbi:antitoxin [Streptomyces sp. NPDC058374]|uniref:antitoxin n=1 Tax=unclassified Streptomyces TaxID=2593676 RepID=UPI00364F9D38
MSFLDNLKAKIAPAKEKVADLTRQHGDKIDQGLDKAAQAVDSRTKGKYSDKIRTGTEKAKGALDQLGQDDRKKDGPERGGQTPGTPGQTARPQHPETGTRKPEGEGPTGS